jgi:hypothetical protein
MTTWDLTGLGILMAIAWVGCFVAHDQGIWPGFTAYCILLVMYITVCAIYKIGDGDGDQQ